MNETATALESQRRLIAPAQDGVRGGKSDDADFQLITLVIEEKP